MRALVAAAMVLVACKTDKAKTEPPAPAAARREHESTPRPTLPTAPAAPDDPAMHPHPGGEEVPVPTADKLDVARVQQIAPVLPHAKRLAPLSVQDKFGQARESWCMATTDATDAAKQVAAQLSREGWSDVTSRASGPRAAVSAMQDTVHVAVTIGGTDAACSGGLVTHVIYHGAKPTMPALEPGEKIH